MRTIERSPAPPRTARGLWIVGAAALVASLAGDLASLGAESASCQGPLPLPLRAGLQGFAADLLLVAGITAWRAYRTLGPETGPNGIAAQRLRIAAQAVLVLGILCLGRTIIWIAAAVTGVGGCG